MDVSIEIHCARCGSANFSLPQGSADGDPLLCNDCGACLGSVSELKQELLEQALAQSAESLRRDLDRRSAGEAA